MWDSIPSRIGTLAETSTVARNENFAAAGARGGVATPLSMEVRALAEPGSSVRVAPGTVVIPQRAAGSPDEAYVARAQSWENLAIAATGAQGRSDLIVARIEDPNVPGSPYPVPSNPATASYAFPRVISNVPAGTTSADVLSADRSEVALARIDIPAGTATITQAMIVDLRALTAAAQTSARTLRATVPSSARALNATGVMGDWVGDALTGLTVPSWATHVRAVLAVSGASFGAAAASAATGTLRVAFAWAGDAGYSTTTPFSLTAPAGGARVSLVAVADAVPIPASRRGGPLTVGLQGRRNTGGSDSVALTLDASSTVVVDVEFYTAVEASG